MKKSCLSTLLFLCLASCLSAQPQLPDKVKVKLPAILSGSKLPRLEEDLRTRFKSEPGCKWGQNEKTLEQTWVVYSDREENVTYMTPDKGKRCTELNFGEAVCIADIDTKTSMALVYTDSRAEYPKIPPHAKSKGWIPMDNLLLWKKCPTDRRGILMKAIIAINLNEMGKDENFIEKKFNSPDNLGKSSTLNMDMNFYYIMKETPNQEFALLCTGAQFSATTLYGWVNRNAYKVWNQRTCLEPNWIPKYVETNRNQLSYVYEDEGGSGIVTQWQFGGTNGDDNPMYKYRMHPDILRFPVLDPPTNDGMVHCTSFADRTGRINNVNRFINVTEDVNRKGEEMLQMNIILAIEASSEMSRYLPAVKTALSKCKDYAKDSLQVQVGLVLYRNQQSGVSTSDVLPLRNYDDAELLRKLEASNANTRLSGDNNVALASAIEKATNSSEMNFKKSQSNLLLIVGNHGTDESGWSEERLLKKLVDNNIQVASIQVMRSASGSSSRYFNFIESLIKQNITQQYKKIAADPVFYPARGTNGVISNDGYLFISSRKGGNPLFATARFNQKQGEAMTPEALTRYINNAINGFAKSAKASRTIYEEALKDIDFYPEFLISKLGEAGYQRWKQVKGISAYAGYARINDLSDSDEWRAILYLSGDELKGLILNLESISTAYEQKESDRTVFVKAIRELMKKQLGGSIPDKEIDEMKPEELEKAIYGIVNIPSENMRFTRHPLNDWINRKRVTDEEYFDMLDSFDKKLKKLKGYQRNYKYRMEVGDEKGGKMYYYWIPLEDLP